MTANLVYEKLRYRACDVAADVNCQFPANLDWSQSDEDDGSADEIRGCKNICMKCGNDVCRSTGCSSIVTYPIKVKAANGRIRIFKKNRLCDNCRDEVREDRAERRARRTKSAIREVALQKALKITSKRLVFQGLNPHEDVCSDKFDVCRDAGATCALPKTHDGWHAESMHVLWGIGVTWPQRTKRRT